MTVTNYTELVPYTNCDDNTEHHFKYWWLPLILIISVNTD